MPGERRLVIAVFGGSAPNRSLEDLARLFGQAIVQRGNAVLTGGTGPGEGSVKDAAIHGAIPRRWVGVARSAPSWVPEPERSRHAIDCYVHPSSGGLVIKTDIGYKRNYLEACMCDGAIALAGEEGTTSEVTFTLSLRRPVALVGDHWRQLCNDLRQPHPAPILDSLVDRAVAHVGSNAFVNGNAIKGRLEAPPPPTVQCFDSVVDMQDVTAVVAWVEQQRGPAAGFFPDLPGHSAVKARYNSWLST